MSNSKMLKLLMCFGLCGVVSGLVSGLACAQTSEYTSVTSNLCVTKKNDGELVQLCQGPNHYQLKIMSADQLQFEVIYQKTPLLTLNAQDITFASMVSGVIEWRKTSRKQAPHGLIVRLRGQSAENSENNQSELLVVKLDGYHACVLGEIPAGKDDNQKAREMLDQAKNTRCPQ